MPIAPAWLRARNSAAAAAVPAAQRRLPVNSNVDLTFTSSEISDALLVPVEALFQRDGRNYAYVVESGKLRVREVQIGASNAQFTVLRGGLKENETVLNDLNIQPTEGLRVTPR